ncbi:PQQ-binding-like beta-propeller repeat protein [Streptomyces sp. NPDC048636]|uniref:outer membrane protein assembly factor BamB family protein n=1 Tax=Streptomyces sp. NPDC048636 TaxID=3155762 RepID=UPI0034149E5C
MELPDSAGAGKSGLAGYQRPLPIALHKGNAYISRPDGLEITNVLKNVPVTLMVRPKHQPVTKLDNLSGVSADNPAEAPLVSSTGGKTLVFNALVTEVPGSGTTKGYDAVELMATSTSTLKKSWSVEIKLTEEDEWADDRDEAYVVGRSGDTVVIYARGELLGVSLKTHKRVWSDHWYKPRPLVVGDTLVAVTNDEGSDDQVVGFDATTGRRLWKSPRVSVAGSEPGLVAMGPDSVMADEYADDSEEDERYFVLDSATGRKRRIVPEDAVTSDCTYDGVSVTVCSGSEGWGSEVAGYDSHSGKELWKLPDESANRIAPKVTLVRQGLVYGETKSGDVVLDARTGRDKETKPGIAPVVCDGYVGISQTLHGAGYSAYRAVR